LENPSRFGEKMRIDAWGDRALGFPLPPPRFPLRNLPEHYLEGGKKEWRSLKRLRPD
jgi:hypothetical protein